MKKAVKSKEAITLRAVLTDAFEREIRDVLRLRRPTRGSHVKASREGRKPVAEWFPEPKPVDFKVSTALYSDGSVQLHWIAGTKKRGNQWRMSIPCAVVEELYRMSSEASRISSENELTIAKLKALLWSELCKKALPAQFEQLNGEVCAFVSRESTRGMRRFGAKVRR